jgi:hypothetical protein
MCLTLPAIGCSFDTQGARELIGGTATYVNFPGERWASGRFSGVSIGGDPKVGEYLLAFRDSVELTLTPAGSHETCSLGASNLYQGSWGFFDSRAPAIAFLEGADESDRGKLSFAFADCTVWSTGLEHAELPHFASESFLVRDQRADGDALVEVDPWNRTQREVASGVQQAYQEYFGGPLVTLEGSDLVMRDAQLRSAVVAQDVSQVLKINQGVAFLAGRKLGVLEGASAGYGLLDLDACELRPLIADGESPGFSFLSPCDEHKLQVYAGYLGRVFQIDEPADGAGARVSLSPYVGDDRVLVLTDVSSLSAPDSRLLGTLWGGYLQGNVGPAAVLRKWGESAFMPPLGASPSFRYRLPPRFLADFDGTTGRLFEENDTSHPIELASGVTELDGNLAIVQADSGARQLLGAFMGTPAVLTSDVSSLKATSWYSPLDKEALAVVHDTGESAGAVDYAVLGQDDWYDAGKIRFERAAENVRPSSVAWSDFGAIGYLRDYDEQLGQGTLSLHFVDSRDDFEQSGVAQWSESRLDDHNVILYTVPRGPNAGVWVAQVR